MTYQEALSYLDSFINYEKRSDFDYKKSFKLERMKSFSRLFGDPHKGIKTIHIGGTKGKGSVSSFVNAILIEAGYSVGLYTSPHLFSLRERIRINGEPISEKDMAGLISEIKERADEIESKVGDKPTYFEVCTMMAFLYFKRKGVDFMVLEVGMGGRLDSTNIAESLLSVITPISHDHTQFLGSDLNDIAYEKCGIIRQDSIVISSPQAKEAMDVIKKVCGERNSSLYVVGKDIFSEIFDSNLEGQGFRLLTRRGEHPHLRIRLLGGFQVENAAVAVTAVEELRSRGIFIDSTFIKNGLFKTRWPGRFQIIRKKPFIVVDGAQNAASASALKKAIENTFDYKKLFLIIGAMEDKDIGGICRELGRIADFAVTTKAKAERACPPEVIKDKILDHNPGADITSADSVEQALKNCREQASEEDLILVTGSLYVVAEAMKRFHEK